MIMILTLFLITFTYSENISKIAKNQAINKIMKSRSKITKVIFKKFQKCPFKKSKIPILISN